MEIQVLREREDAIFNDVLVWAKRGPNGPNDWEDPYDCKYANEASAF